MIELSAHLKAVEAKYQYVEEKRQKVLSRCCCSLFDHAIIAHQDGMMKVDLPYFCVTATSNLNHYRYSVTSNIKNFTNEVNIVPHELRPPGKTEAK